MKNKTTETRRLMDLLAEGKSDTNEVISEGYAASAIRNVVKKHGDSEFKLKLQIESNPYVRTNWLDITIEEALKISKILKD